MRRAIGNFVDADTDQAKFDEGMGRLLQALKISK
jgi:hypothetical protein